MAAISTWSTTAASNNSASPDGAPEGWAPSHVNNWARETMAAVRTQHEDAEWIDWGHTITYVSATQFTVNGVDVTAAYHVGRRIRMVGSTTGTIYGRITASSFSTNTSITIAWDGASDAMVSETLTASLHVLSGYGSGFATANKSPEFLVVWSASDNASLTWTLSNYVTIADYRRFVLEFDNLLPATDGATLWLRIGDGAASSTAVYSYAYASRNDLDEDTGGGATTQAQWVLSRAISNTAAEGGCSGQAVIRPLASGWPHLTFESSHMNNSSVFASNSGGGVYETALTELDTIYVQMSSGNITSGDFLLYGVR